MAVVHEATEDQADLAAGILADAFEDDPLWAWTFPDPTDRAEILPRFFRVFVDRAFATDRVLIAGPDLGAALWIRRDDAGDTNDSADADGQNQAGDDELPPIYGPYLDRLGQLDELLRDAQPDGVEHLYLSLIGVRPEARGTGLGGALLTHRFDGRHRQRGRVTEDQQAYPAYLEASSERNKALYERHGFRPLHDPIRIQDGPTIHPMWREPEHETDRTEGAA